MKIPIVFGLKIKTKKLMGWSQKLDRPIEGKLGECQIITHDYTKKTKIYKIQEESNINFPWK